MPTPKCPCRGCTNRTTGDRVTDCHTNCGAFNVYHNWLEGLRKKANDTKLMVNFGKKYRVRKTR